MSFNQDAERLANTIKDVEARLRVFNSTLETIKNEIVLLTQLQAQIEENLEFLRKKHIIALAQEYKKAKDELFKAKGRLAKCRIDSENVGKAARENVEILQKLRTDYANALKGPNNILPFGRKNGQSRTSEES